jgi:hypothetical protein
MSKRLSSAAFFIVLYLASLFFFMGFHSIDIAHAQAIHHNDWNKAKITDGYLDLRKYEDCNLMGCHRYQTFYMTGMTLLGTSYLMLFGALLFIGVHHGK